MTESTPHLSLYRRWRSQTFAEIVGQEDVVRTLRNAVAAREVAHAYLFAGERGIGKTSVARILARAVNCLQSAAGEPCNACPNCKTILAARSLDILEIDGASNRGIDHIRKLREEVNFAPTDLRMKVYIIDEVHMLTNEAFNALLKTLEEPPAHAMFVFATTEPHKVPRTIISRCQAFEFRRLAPDKIDGHLRHVAETEGIQLTDGARALIARRANGGMRDALVMLEQAASHEAGPITEAAVLDMLGLAGRDTQEAFIVALEAGHRTALLSLIDGLAERGKDLELFLADVILRLRERIVDEAPDAAQAVRLARGLLEIRADLFRALDRQIRMEIGVLALAESLTASTEPLPLHEREVVEKPARKIASTPKDAAPKRETAKRAPGPDQGTRTLGEPETAEPSSAAEIAPPPTNLSPQLQDRWLAMLAEVEKDRIAIAAYLTEATPSLSGSKLVLLFHPEHTFHKESLEKHENLQYLAGTVRRHFGDAVHVEVLYDEHVVRKPLPRDVLLEKARLVCEIFDGKIVKEAL